MSMINDKRQSHKYETYIEKIKQLCKLWNQEKKSLTYIEDLSNEIFYEIFDYLDGCEIYQSFSNLNRRFQNILSSSILQLKINLLPFINKDIHHDSINIISQQKHQIISLRLMYISNIDRLFRLITFNSSFSHLESLILTNIKSNDQFQCLSVLISLPRLLSLVLGINYNLKDFTDIYNLVFNLPLLKYIRIYSEIYEPFIRLPIANNDQFSSIEYLIINHSCSLNDLILILSYTPRLCHLTCRELIRTNENIVREIEINLPNLIYICISECYVVFDKLEIFIRKISLRLEVLRMITYWDVTYLDPDRWERLIIEYIPYLREFSLQHHEFIDDDFEVTEYHKLINQFTSSFWNMQKYIFELIIDLNDWSWSEIIYSIQSQQKKKFHEIPKINAYSNQNIKLILTKYDISSDIKHAISAPSYGEYKELFTDNTITLFNLLQITQLDVLYNGIFVETLIDLIYYLPNLNSLRIWSLILRKTKCTSDRQASMHYSLTNANKIIKVNIQYVTEFAQIQFLIDFCSNMQYLEIGCVNDIDLILFTRLILMQNRKRISHLHILCLSIQSVNDKIVNELQDMINFEKLCHNYTIKHLCNKIYLQWKSYDVIRHDILN